MHKLAEIYADRKMLMRLLVIFLAYVITGYVGLKVSPISGFVSIIWPPSGIALVAVIFWGYEILPAVFLGAFLLNILFGLPPLAVTLIAFGNTLQAFLGAWLLARFGFNKDLDRSTDTFLYFGCGGIINTAIGAAIGVFALKVTAFPDGRSFFEVWFAWWLGAMLGVLIIGYLFLGIIRSLRGRFINEWKTTEGVSAIVLWGVIAFITTAAYFDLIILQPQSGESNVVGYILIFLLGYSAFRFGPLGVSVPLFLVTVLAITGTELGMGPYRGMPHANAITTIQTSIALLTVLYMTIGALASERIRSRREIRRQTELLLEAEKISHLGSWNVELGSGKISVSDELYHVMGLAPVREGGIEKVLFNEPKMQSFMRLLIDKMLIDRAPFEFDHELAKGNEKCWIKVKGRIIEDAKGKPERIVGTVQDITREKLIDRAKSEFVSMASHQLRTPLASMKWYSGMLSAGDVGDLNEAQKKYLAEITENNQRMIDLVNSLLNVSRIELGTYTLNPVRIEACAVVDDVIREHVTVAEEKGVKVTSTCDSETEWISADPSMLRLILSNLLSNAIKYSPSGSEVKVHAGFTHGEFLLEVCDQGYGIPKEEQGKIFTKFYRAENVRTMEPDGSGLGLYIVNSLTEQAGGKVLFESEEGKGTTFKVVIPLYTTGEAKQGQKRTSTK